tara:strand:- start:963 stop:1304 length:342 start_codon:yes stop_codon:yes gene_type:complete
MSEEENTTEQLMSALISKMESMDSDIRSVRNENIQLRKMVENPAALLKRAGYVRTNTPLSIDMLEDPFRNDETVLKSESNAQLDSFTNEEVHEMSWEEIHEMAAQHREVRELY